MTSSLHENSAPRIAVADLDLTGLAPLNSTIPHAVMYTLPHCPNCDRLKVLFKAARLPVVAVSLADASGPYQLFHDELHVQQTPIVLIHNTFTSPAYFSGFSTELARFTVKSIRARLLALEDSSELASVDRYVADLGAAVEPGQSHPFVRPEIFARLAASHVDSASTQPSRITMPASLSLSTVLLDRPRCESTPPLH